MAPRLAPPALVLGAVLADAAGVHGLAFWLVLLALPAAAATAFVAVSDALDTGGWLRGWTTAGALALLVLGSAVREGAPRGSAVPALAVSAAVAALVLYALPGFVWLLEPLRPRPRARTTTA
jgi:hypothetical protein